MHYLPFFALTGVREIDDASAAASAGCYLDHLCRARPRIIASGKGDDRTGTVYPGG